MIRAKDIQEKLLHLVGWKQSYDTTELRIADSLTISESGLYFQQAHPLLTLQNMASVAPDFANMAIPEWSPTETYQEGNLVTYLGKYYKATEESIGLDPGDSHEQWASTNPFSEWLEDKTKASIQKAIARFCNEKSVQGAVKELCESKVLFDGTSRLADTVKNRRNLVGMEIVPIRSRGVTTKINKIGLHFTEPGGYTIYLMHSSSEQPYRIIHLTKVKKNSMEWFAVDDVYLPYMTDDTDAGGSWYLCYFQDELPEGSMAIKHDRDWSKEPCKSCSRTEYLSWLSWSRYLEIHPFFVNSEFVAVGDDFGMWDIDKNQYTYDNNYGINLEVSVGCDITDFIIGQKAMFQDVISKQVAVDMLRELAYNANVRTNRHTINASRIDILYEVDGDSASMKKSGLGYQLDQAFKAIKMSTEGIDRICLPCREGGIKYRSI